MHFKLVTAFITSRCNMRCRTCFYRNSLNRFKDLTLGQWKIIAGKVSCDTLLLSGGEPFARKDIAELSMLFKPRHLIIPTNGTMINYEAVKFLCNNLKRVSISLSIDGVGELQNSIRGIDCWDKVVKSVEELKRLRKRHSNLELMVTTTLNKLNEDRLGPVFVFVRKNGFDRHFFEVIREFEWNREISGIRDLESLHKKILNYYATGKNWLETAGYNEFYKQQRAAMKGGKWRFMCRAGRDFAIVDSNGDMRLCEFLPPVGNLLRSSPEQLLGNKKAGKQFETIRKHGCDCTHCVALAMSMRSNRWLQYLRSVINYGIKHYTANV